MRKKKQTVAMLLAGGQGSRLGVLTSQVAKPAIPFCGKYRIIDFPLSNCVNSGIDTVGVLTQYRPLELNAYIGNGQPWDLDRIEGGVAILPPYARSGEAGEWYKGTANAIYQNINFIDRYDPDYVVVLSGDHIYKMDYSEMIRYHREKGAACTIAVLNVSLEEATRFGILNTYEDNEIYEFEEKPAHPKSTKASMGIYVFSWDRLRKYLEEDEQNPDSSNDFGKNIIPMMIAEGDKVYAYEFKGYWKDVGTIESLWEANMAILSGEDISIDLHEPSWRIYSRNPNEPPHFVSEEAIVKNSMVTEGANIYGHIENSVIFYGCYVGTGAIVRNSVIMPNARIEAGAAVDYAIVGQEAVIGAGARVGQKMSECEKGQIAVIGNELTVGAGVTVGAGEMLAENRLK